MKPTATSAQKHVIAALARSAGVVARVVESDGCCVIALLVNPGGGPPDRTCAEGAASEAVGGAAATGGLAALCLQLEQLQGVAQVGRYLQPYRLVSRQTRSQRTVVEVGGVKVGGPHTILIAGPCAVEGAEQLLTCARAARKAGAQLLRGGAYKPRSSPYSFAGLEQVGLTLLAEVRAQTGLGVITEVMGTDELDRVAEVADVLQVGARNCQNFALLRAVGAQGKPVMLKRGPGVTLEELLLAAEHVAAAGNLNIILCERGIRTFEPWTRHTLDLAAVPLLQQRSHLPVVVDPSHGTGNRELVGPLARAAVAAGADGVMVEVHPHPEHAWSDGPQALTLPMLAELGEQLAALAAVMQRPLASPGGPS